jgi:NADH dehydrogenase
MKDNSMQLNIPDSNKPRVVIVGAGFAGFTLANKLKGKEFQIVLLDKNNYFQFQPLYYQVAMSGLEPSSICFPLRKNFQNEKDLYVRVAEVHTILPTQKRIESNIGQLKYDYLVLATGAGTNFYGNSKFEKHSIPLKSVSEALYLRNAILDDLEHAVMTIDPNQQDELMDIVIVGGGPTGVELAGALSEMKRHILPKDYPDLNSKKMDIHLIQASSRLLDGMSEKASEKAFKDLTKMGVRIHLNKTVSDVAVNDVTLSDGRQIHVRKIIWTAGVKGMALPGLPDECYDRSGRIKVNEYAEVIGLDDVYAIGDLCLMISDKFPKGFPGLAPVALQQARYLAKKLRNINKSKSQSPFRYVDKGTMATIGRNKAVLDFHGIFLSGFIAWLAWLFVHIYYLIGIRNKMIVFINWLWSYIFYDQALRLNIRPKIPNK